MKTLYIIRHCQASGQGEEAPLTVDGMKQAKNLAVFLHKYPINRIISSPYIRAIDSIKPYSEKSGIRIELDERLRERVLSSDNLENWFEHLQLSFEDFSLKLKGGESSAEAKTRAEMLINELRVDNNEHIVLVSHGNLSTLLLNNFDEKYGFDEWKTMSNPDVYEVLLEPQLLIRRIWRG